MSIKAFYDEIRKGLPDSVYLFYASDSFFIREALEAIKNLVPENERDFNLHIFDFSEAGNEIISIQSVLDVANTASFFSRKRFTIAIINLKKLSKRDNERLFDYVSNPSPGSVLIIFHIGALKKDIKDKFKTLNPISLDIREFEIPAWIKQRAGIYGIEISQEAIEYLIGFVGPDFGLLSAEIEKISLIGSRKIGASEISDIVTGGRLYNVFSLTDAIRKNDIDGVFKIYKNLKDTLDDFSLLGALNWEYGRNLHSGMNLKNNEYFQNLFEILNKADIGIKSPVRNFPVEYILLKLLRLQEGQFEKRGR